MARLQDFQNVTPTSSDKILIVQSQGQGLAPHTIKLDSANPTGTGSLSLNRKANTTVGNYSVAVGYSNEASGSYSHAEGNSTTASGAGSHAQGVGTIANHLGQHVIGTYNTADSGTAGPSSRGNYIEIAGNGANNANRSNARTLDWSGNEVLAGGLKINGNQDVHGITVSADRVRFTSATTLSYTGYSISCPTGHTYLCSVLLFFGNSTPKEIAVSYSSTSTDLYDLIFRSDACSGANFILKGGQTAYVWGRFGSEANNGLDYIIVDIAP